MRRINRTILTAILLAGGIHAQLLLGSDRGGTTGGGGTPSLVQSSTCRGSGTAVSCTALSATTAGNFVLLAFSSFGGVTPSSVACGGTSMTSNAADQYGYTQFWSIPNNPGGLTTCTVNYGTANQLLGIVSEWTNINHSAPFDKTNGVFSGGVTWSTGATATLAQTAETAFGFCYCTANNACATVLTLTSPFVSAQNITYADAIDGSTAVLGYVNLASTTGVAFGGASTGSMYLGIVGTYKY